MLLRARPVAAAPSRAALYRGARPCGRPRPAAPSRPLASSSAAFKRRARKRQQAKAKGRGSVGTEEVMSEVLDGNDEPFRALRNATSAKAGGGRSAVAQWPVAEVEKLRRGQKSSGEERAENESLVRGPLFLFADETFASEDLLKRARAPPAPSSIEERVHLEPALYSPETAPSRHARDARGRYAQAADEAVARVPPGVASRRMRQEFEAVGGPLLMVREPAWSLKEALLSGKGPRTVTLHGWRGTGKTAALHYVAQAAAERGWLILHARADELVDDRLGMIRERADGSGVFEQPRLAAELARRLLDGQRDTLSRMRARDGRTLAELLDGCAADSGGGGGGGGGGGDEAAAAATAAAASSEDAADVFARFLDEVRVCEDVPTLVLVDNVNAWDTSSEFHDPATRQGRLHATRLGLVRAFAAFHSEAPAGGMSVFATSGNFSQRRVKDHYIKQSERQYHVRPYSLDETVASLAHYRTSNLMHFPVDERSVAKVYAVSGGNPADVFEAAVLL